MKRKVYIFVTGSLAGFFILVALLAPWIANEGVQGNLFPLSKFGPDTPPIETSMILASPGDHPMGTDQVGRDVFALLVHGLKNSIYFSLLVVGFSVIIGILMGGLMGFLGGKFDLIVSRLLELVGNFPIFFLQLTLLAFFDQGYGILFFVMSLAGWIPYARLTRAQVLHLRNQDFIQAAQAIGSSKVRLFFRHLIPNAWTPSVIYIPFDLSSTIVGLGALSFLGFGEPINVPSIGQLLDQAREHFQTAWWLAVFPGVTLFMLTLSLTLFGSSLRDLLDPKES